VGGGFWRIDYCFTKNLDMVLYSHSKGSGKHRNGTRTPGSSRTLKIAKFGFSHVGGLYRAGYPVKVYALPFQNMGLLSEQLVRPNPDGQTLPA
jgi:hypothetical protein